MKVAPAVAVGALMVLTVLTVMDARINEGDQQLATRAIAANTAWRAHIARDRKASEANHRRQSAALEQMATSLGAARRFQDSILAADTAPPPASEPAPPVGNPVAEHWYNRSLHWFKLSEWQRMRADSNASAADAAQKAFALARADASRAWRLVDEGRVASLMSDEAMRAQRCRVLFLPCPSRTVVAVGGFVLGAVAVAVAKR